MQPRFQLGDTRVPLLDVGGHPVQHLVNGAHMVSPQREGKPDSRHVTAGHQTVNGQVQRRVISFEPRQLPAMPHDQNRHGDEHREGSQCCQDQDGYHTVDRATSPPQNVTRHNPRLRSARLPAGPPPAL